MGWKAMREGHAMTRPEMVASSHIFHPAPLSGLRVCSKLESGCCLDLGVFPMLYL